MKRVKVQEDKDCWFCWANPTISKELIIKETKNEFYLAMPKGPVTDEHFLIVPKQHIAHSLDFTPSQADSYSETVAQVLGFLNG